MPGVLMVEALAQAACVHSFMQFERPKGTVIGLGGVEKCRFRDSVKPGTDLWIAGTMERFSVPRAYLKWVGYILKADGSLVCEGTVIGIGI